MMRDFLDNFSDRVSTVSITYRKVLRTLVRTLIGRLVLPARGDKEQRQAGLASARAGRGLSTDVSALCLDSSLLEYASQYKLTDDNVRDAVAHLQGAHAAGGGSTRLTDPDPTIPQDEGVAAFFDVDNTLIKGASLLLFARGLARHQFFPLRDVVGFVWKQCKFRFSGQENMSDIAYGRDKALSLVEGKKESEIVDLAREIWKDRIAERIFPGTKMLAEQHVKAGQQVWLVTATPIQLAQVIARELGFTGALGTVAEVRDGRFTGRMVGDILHGSGKKYAVVALAAQEGLCLDKCSAYSDSVNDLPMLSVVGHAIAVNPDSRLRQEAYRRGWEVRDYRRARRAIYQVAERWSRKPVFHRRWVEVSTGHWVASR